MARGLPRTWVGRIVAGLVVVAAAAGVVLLVVTVVVGMRPPSIEIITRPLPTPTP